MRKRISNVDLCWIVVDQMTRFGDCPTGFSVAIVPEATVGWRVVVQSSSRARMTTSASRRLEAIEGRLRARYSLHDD